MERKVNYTWLFLLLVAVIAAAVVLWLCVGKTAGSYSGGILIELPENLPRITVMAEEWL